MKYNIILAEDHKGFREAMIHHLQRLSFAGKVMPASNGMEVLELLAKDTFDIVLMDVRMPVMDGIECTAKISASYPDVKVIAMTQFEDYYTVNSMFTNGAKGYVSKFEGIDEIKTAIKVVMNNGIYKTGNVKELMEEMENKKLDPHGTAPFFNTHELMIFDLLSQGLNTHDIGNKLNLSHRTVEWHKAKMMEKTKTNNIVTLLNFAREHRIIT